MDKEEKTSLIAENTHICPKCGHKCIGEIQVKLESFDGKITYHCTECLIEKLRKEVPELNNL